MTNTRYLFPAEVVDSSFVHEDGNDGLLLVLNAKYEPVIHHTLWLTEEARERNTEDLMALGVPLEILRTEGFWRYAPNKVKGQWCEIHAIDHTDGFRLKPIMKSVPTEKASRFAGLFSNQNVTA